jgi:hypothetical protein
MTIVHVEGATVTNVVSLFDGHSIKNHKFIPQGAMVDER